MEIEIMQEMFNGNSNYEHESKGLILEGLGCENWVILEIVSG